MLNYKLNIILFIIFANLERKRAHNLVNFIQFITALCKKKKGRINSQTLYIPKSSINSVKRPENTPRKL